MIKIKSKNIKSVRQSGMFELKFDGKVYKRVKAKELYNLIMESTYNRAEPGVIYLDNANSNNPIEYIAPINCTNPCLVGDTIVKTTGADKTIKEIVDLINNGKDVFVNTFNTESNKIEEERVVWGDKTRENANVIKLELMDKTIIKLTPDHKVYTKNRGYVEASSLTEVDILIYNLDEISEIRIKKIKVTSNEDVYDITTEKNHNFFANNTLVHNCGEIGGNPDLTTVCLLGSLNVTQYVNLVDGKPIFDWKEYEEDIKIFTRMLDSVCDLSDLPLVSYSEAVKNFRQFGMGLTGLGSMFIMLGIRYGSEESVAIASKLAQIKENMTWQASALLAKEKGAFPLYDKEKFTNTRYFKSKRLSKKTKEMIIENGVRNAKTSTNPPSGNTSILCDYITNGIEPPFAIETVRKVTCAWPEGLNSDNIKDMFKETKKKDFTYWTGVFETQEYYYEPHNRGLCEVHILRDFGFQWLMDNGLPTKGGHIVETKDLGIEEHLAIQEVVQFYCNQSVSKTCNLPNKFSFKKFKGLYMDAWKRGLNGFTTYRDGSMESVLSTLENAEEKREIIKQDIKLPTEFLNGPTTVIKREKMKFYINFSYLPDDVNLSYPVAMWINTNSKGEAIACNRACKSLIQLALGCGVISKIVDGTWEKALGDTPHNRLARMISLCMRHNIPREDILVALQNTTGDNISSLLTAVRKFIGKTIEDGREIVGMKCPECGGEELRMESGCFVCNSCQYAGCA